MHAHTRGIPLGLGRHPAAPSLLLGPHRMIKQFLSVIQHAASMETSSVHQARRLMVKDTFSFSLVPFKAKFPPRPAASSSSSL